MHDHCLHLFCGCGCTRASLCLLSVLMIWTTQSDLFIHDVLSSRDSLSVQCRAGRLEGAGQLEGIPCHEWRSCEVCISGGRPGGNLAICFQMNCSLWSFSRREVELSVTFFFFLPCRVIRRGLFALVTSPLDEDSGAWVVSKISHFGISVLCSLCCDVILCSLDCSAEPNIFLVIDIIWVLYLDIVFTIWLNQIFNRSVKTSHTS